MRPQPGPSRTAWTTGLTFWRRSIQARVVASTLVLSALVMSAVSWFLLQQTRDGLVSQRVDAVVAEANAETAAATERLAQIPGTEFDTQRQQNQLIEPIISRGQTRGYGVILVGPEDRGEGSVTDYGDIASKHLDPDSVPRSLRRHLADEGTGTAWTYTSMATNDGSEAYTGSAVVVGTRIQLPADGRVYSLYYVFPLQEESATLRLVSRALLTAGVLLLALVAALTWLVTRQVVTPLRVTRQVAERLASGNLSERLTVRGQDDIARLSTSFNQMASSLQGQIRQLEELSRLQRRFVSDVSHELRTPLTTVRMAGDMLYDERERFDTGTARAAELLHTELDRFELLLADLLEISRFDAGAAVLDIDEVNLVDVAHRVAEVTKPLAQQRGTRVVVRAEGECTAEADVRRVERIVRNLVSNAIDHAESSDVEIQVAVDETAAAITVRDHGVGLKPGEAALVFSRFWRADPARARTSGGTGLGLSISLEDAHLHAGWLQAWGAPGRGAQFRLTLPRVTGTPLHRSPLPLVPEDAGR